MSVTYTGTSAGILGKAETEFQSATTSGNPSLGKDAFLTLLVTQMKYQDPLNPTSDKEFLSQLAQFSSLEQLTNLNSGVDKLNTAQERQDMIGAVSFIGKDVKAKGDSLSKDGDKISTLFFNLSEAAAKVTVNVFDDNGNIIKTEDLGTKAAGSQTYQWDGKDWNGNKMSDGVYHVGVGAETADGRPILTDLKVTGTIVGMANVNGQYLLSTSDGRQVFFTDIEEVVTPTTATAS